MSHGEEELSDIHLLSRFPMIYFLLLCGGRIFYSTLIELWRLFMAVHVHAVGKCLGILSEPFLV